MSKENKKFFQEYKRFLTLNKTVYERKQNLFQE